VVHGGAVAADHLDARLRADHRQHRHVRRLDRAGGEATCVSTHKTLAGWSQWIPTHLPWRVWIMILGLPGGVVSEPYGVANSRQAFARRLRVRLDMVGLLGKEGVDDAVACDDVPAAGLEGATRAR
jgi:hypothetical protein